MCSYWGIALTKGTTCTGAAEMAPPPATTSLNVEEQIGFQLELDVRDPALSEGLVRLEKVTRLL